jgi:formate dehydrogenase maturation protein FdhE
MDTGKGNFDIMGEPEAERLKKLFPRVADRIFKVGEMVHIKDSFFRIKGIKPDELRLKLLSNEQSAAARKAAKDAETHGKALDFVNRAEVAEEHTLLRMLVSKDKLAAYEMLIALRESYKERLARIDTKLEELAVDLLGDDFRPINEAVDAMIAEEEDTRYAKEVEALGCLHHDFSDDRQVCRVCGITVKEFRIREAAAKEELLHMREEFFGKEEP